MIKELSYQFHELEILPNDIAELLGFKENSIPDPFPVLIDNAIKSAAALCRIKAGYKYFTQTEVDTKNFKLIIGEQIFSTGKIITNQLNHATSCALFVCTAGNDIDNTSKQLAKSGDQLQSYIYDVLGSIVAEKTRIKIELELLNDLETNGLKISDSYSPGYCDWNITDQTKLFSLLPANFCGITLSKSLLMTPIKSVSGIIGIGKTLKQKGYQCNWCIDKNCLYGRIKREKKN